MRYWCLFLLYKKKVQVIPGHDKFEVPMVDKREAQVLSIHEDIVSLMDSKTFENLENHRFRCKPPKTTWQVSVVAVRFLQIAKTTPLAAHFEMVENTSQVRCTAANEPGAENLRGSILPAQTWQRWFKNPKSENPSSITKNGPLM